jgi:hypothetical protein
MTIGRGEHTSLLYGINDDPKKEPSSSCVKQRYVLVFLAFLGFVNVYGRSTSYMYFIGNHTINNIFV